MEIHNHAKTCDLNKMCQIGLDTSDTLGIFKPRKSVSDDIQVMYLKKKNNTPYTSTSQISLNA